MFASPAPFAAAQSCTNNAGSVVDAIYRQVLGRQPDAQSSGLVPQLASGRMTVRQAVAEVARSSEYRARLWEPVVEATFRQVRNAAPERDHVESVARSIAEGRQTLDDVTIAFAAEEVQSQSPDTAVIAMYKRLLGRDPSPEEVTPFSERLQREGAEAIARTMVASPEFRQRFGRNGVPSQGPAAYEAPVKQIYRQLLGRDADPDGLQQFTRVAAESGFEAVVDQIQRSPEYMQKAGDAGVPGTDVRLCAPVGTSGR